MKKVVIFFIQLYRKYISPLKKYPTCRYIPTCSEYAVQAVEKYGAMKGIVMAIKRILRCNPFSEGGYDPVP